MRERADDLPDIVPGRARLLARIPGPGRRERRRHRLREAALATAAGEVLLAVPRRLPAAGDPCLLGQLPRQGLLSRQGGPAPSGQSDDGPNTACTAAVRP